MSAAAPPEPLYLWILPARLGRQVPSHEVSREACILGPAQDPLLISRAPNRDPRSLRSPPTAGIIASALRFGETRKNAPRETLQLLPFSCLERCFINYWDF